MNYLKKTFLITLLATGVLFIFSACPSCVCSHVEGYYFDVQDMNVYNGEIECCQTFPIDSIVWDNYWLHLDFEVTYYAPMVGEAEKNDMFFPSLNLMPAAKAYSCGCHDDYNGMYGSEEIIEEFTITTVHDYNENYKANDTINTLLDIGLQTHEDTNLNEYLEEMQGVLAYENYGFTFNEAPDSTTQTFQANIILKLANGETYTAMNEEILFIP